MAVSRNQPVLLVFVALLGFANAFSLESLIEPLMVYSNEISGGDRELALEKLSELGRLVDDTARTFFNLTIGTSTSLTYGNALFVIFAVSIAVLGGLALLWMASTSILTGNFNDVGADYTPEEAAADAARFFLSYINSTTSISASYALVIIIGASLAMLALSSIAYLVASTIFTGTSIHSFNGKRSIPDDENDDLLRNWGWTKILEILDMMEEQFQRTGASKKDSDDQECKKLALCKLFADVRKGNLNESQSKLVEISTKLSELVEKYGLDANSGSSVNSRIYLKAKKLGAEQGSCEQIFSKCKN